MTKTKLTKEQKLERINQITEMILELKLARPTVKSKITIQTLQQELNKLTLSGEL